MRVQIPPSAVEGVEVNGGLSPERGLSTRSVRAAIALLVLGLFVGCLRIAPPAKGSQRTWRSLLTPRVVLLTDLDEDLAIEAARTIERLAYALEEVAFPYQEKPQDRVEILLFRDKDDFSAGVEEWVSGEFRTNSSWSSGVSGQICLAGELFRENQAKLVHELTHRYVRYYFPGAPTWLNEGLAEYMDALHYDGDGVSFGTGRLTITDWRSPTDVFALSAREFYVRGLHDEASDRLRSANYGWAWKVVHALASPETGALHAAFLDYLDRLTRLTPAKEALTQAFAGFPGSSLAEAINTHHLGVRYALRTKLIPPVIAPEVEVLSPADGRSIWLSYALQAPRDIDRDGARAEVLELTSSGTPAASLLMLRAAVERADGHQERVLPLLRRIYRSSPGDADALSALVSALGAQPELSEELEPLVEALARRAVSAQAMEVVARADLHAGRYNRAATFAVRATQREPACLNCWMVRAKAHEQLGDLAKAYQSTALALALADDDALEAKLEAELARLRDALKAP